MGEFAQTSARAAAVINSAPPVVSRVTQPPSRARRDKRSSVCGLARRVIWLQVACWAACTDAAAHARRGCCRPDFPALRNPGYRPAPPVSEQPGTTVRWYPSPSTLRREGLRVETRHQARAAVPGPAVPAGGRAARRDRRPARRDAACPGHRLHRTAGPGRPGGPPGRSEEHTSELQSRGHLVCRLLLEKKN